VSAQPGPPPPRVPTVARPRLRVLPIPPTDPDPLSPHDLGLLLHHRASAQPPFRQGTLSVTFEDDEEAWSRPRRTSTAELPEPSVWAPQALRVLLEVMDGLRPARQMTRWVDHRVAERVARRGVVARRRGGRYPQPGRVCSVHVSMPRDGICEVASLVLHRNRYRAVAMQMTGTDGRWVITALEVG
jgi:hypothetical protein